MRPAVIINKKITFDKVNNPYSTLIYNYNLLNKNKNLSEINKQSIYLDNQNLVNEIHDYIVDSISGKNGLIRRLLLGYRINFFRKIYNSTWEI